jgi:hypothetical protein
MKPNRIRKVAVGTTKKSIATRSRRWFSRNVRHFGEGGLRLRGRYLATVETATTTPSRPARCGSGARPRDVRLRHPPDQLHDLAVEPGTAGASGPAPTPPEALERLPMPTDDGRGLDDRQGVSPAVPPLGENDPESSAPPTQSQPSPTAGAEQGRDLLAQRQVLEGELPSRPKQRSRRPEDGPNQAQHGIDRTRRNRCCSRRFRRMGFLATTGSRER